MDPSEQDPVGVSEAKPMEAKTWKRRICATWGPFCCRLRVRLFVCSVERPPHTKGPVFVTSSDPKPKA